ncbi:hypothetical protein BJV78DRAFT_1281525 [Lactifluus subvellereus]|nr:hypothetical protein BJV78DRAFT_1281525 [Lactifluus subvellereus]
MDFFSLLHQKQPAVTEDEDGATDLFAKAIDERFNNGVLVASSSAPTNNNRITPLSLSIASIPRNNRISSPHIPSRSHSHHLPASSLDAALFTPVLPADLPELLSDPHTLILDIRPLPPYLVSRLPRAVPLSVPSTLLKRPLFSTSKLAEMLPNRAARRKFSNWHFAQRILVYDADATILAEGSNILGLLRKFRAEAGLPADPPPSGAVASSGELRLSWLKGGFQAVLREQQSLLDSNVAQDEDDEDATPSPPAFPESDYLGNSQPTDSTSIPPRPIALSLPTANRPTLLRTKHLPMSAFTISSTTSQRSGSVRHKLYLGQQAAAISANPITGLAPGRTEFVSRPLLSGAPTVPQPTSDPGPNIAFNPFFDTIRQNFELSHGISERIPLKISRIAKDRIGDLPFTWLRELGRWATADDEGSDDEVNIEGGSGSGSGSGISGGEHSGMSSDSDEDSGNEHAFRHFARANPPGVTSTDLPTNRAATTPEQAEGSEALAMQFYRIELGEQRRLMGVMEHHSRESGRVVEGGETKNPKSKVKRSKQRSKGTGRSSRGKHGSREFPYSITAGVEKGSKNRYRNIWPFEHARVRLQKQKPKQRSSAKPRTPPSNSIPGSLHPLTLPQPTDFLPPVRLSLASARSIQLPLSTPVVSSSTDDYVNASHVQPLGTKRRYIATQGPLPETFNDFWLLVWEQNVHVIVMLTREVEGTTIKCGNYWSGENFGPLRLKLLEATGAIEKYEKSDRRAPGDSFFPFTCKDFAAPSETGSGHGSFTQSTVRRVLELSHTNFPHLPPRRIVQFQYLDWPDLNVPSDTHGVLELIREVEHEVDISEETRGLWEGHRRPEDWQGRAMIGKVRPRRSTPRSSREESPSGTRSGSSGSGASSPSLDSIDSDTGIVKHALGERPVLLHCSAGVGRTGGFIAIDAVLDGIRREMRKRREGLQLAGSTWGDSQISRSRSGRDSTERTGRTSGSNTSDKDRTSSGDEVPAMDVDEASGGGRVPPAPGLVVELPAQDNKAAMHVPVVGMISPSSSTRPPRRGGTSYPTPMEVDLAATSPWTATDSRDKLQAWIPRAQQSEPLSSPSSISAHESRPAASSESVRPSVPQALSRSLSPSGDSAFSDTSALSVPLSMQSLRSFSPVSPETNRISSQHCTLAGLATTTGANQRIRTSTPTTAPLTAALPPHLMSVAGIAQPVTKRVSGSSVPPDTGTASDSSRGRSTGASSLLSSGTTSGSRETLPTDPSVTDLSSATKTDLQNLGLRLPLPAMSTRKSGSKSSESPPANEDSPPNGSDPYYSQSQSQSDQHSPPAFDYARPRRLHDDRRSPILLSTLDEPIHRVIEDMREQRMSLCQSLRQYVFVHRAVIEGVLMLVDEERTLYGKAWKDSDLEDLSKFVSARFPTGPATTSESGSIGSAADTAGSGPAGNSGSESKFIIVSQINAKRRASPTELPKEDKRGDMRTSKRPIIKRPPRSNDENSHEDIVATPAPGRVEWR